MFIKCALAKFEWKGQPEEITDIFIENLLLVSSDYNFCVTNFKSTETDESASNEFWSYYNVLERSPKYGVPSLISVRNYKGETYATNDFVLFNNYKNTATLTSSYINYYSQMIGQINRALNQHITASKLVATIYTTSKEEQKTLETLFGSFDGVKIVKHDTSLIDGGKKADIVQFDIVPRLEELERLKHEIEKDLFLRLGIDYGTDKTHMTNQNLKDSEQPIDLINAYELKLREDFCKRYNKWRNAEKLSVKIHNITSKNSIQEGGGNTNVSNNGADKPVSDSGI